MVALRGGERDGGNELHGVFLLLLAVILAVILALRGVRLGFSGHRSMRTTGRMMTVQRAPRILPVETRQRSRGNAMIMVGRGRDAGQETSRELSWDCLLLRKPQRAVRVVGMGCAARRRPG